MNTSCVSGRGNIDNTRTGAAPPYRYSVGGAAANESAFRFIVIGSTGLFAHIRESLAKTCERRTDARESLNRGFLKRINMMFGIRFFCNL